MCQTTNTTNVAVQLGVNKENLLKQVTQDFIMLLQKKVKLVSYLFKLVTVEKSLCRSRPGRMLIILLLKCLFTLCVFTPLALRYYSLAGRILHVSRNFIVITSE